ARNLNAVIFDKTGTLTKGEFGVTDVLPFADDIDEKELVELAASVEAESEHPIAAGIVNEAETKRDAKEFTSIKGKGAKATVDGKEIMVVSPGYLKEDGIEYPEDKVAPLSEEGK